MEKKVQAATNHLIEVIRESELYERYQKSAAELEASPEILEQLMDLRIKTIRLYEEAPDEELYEESDKLSSDYEELQKIPEVNEFLETEEELADVLRTVSEQVLHSMNMRFPSQQK